MSKIKLLSTSLLGMLALVIFSCNDSGSTGNINLQISSVTPTRGTVGTRVIIKGSGFVPQLEENIVTFNNTPAKTISVNASQVVVEVPVGATTGPIQLKIANKTVTGPTFTVIIPGGKELSIGGIDPTSGKVGDQVTISGCGFKADVSQNTVKFNGILAQVVSVSGVQSAKVDDSKDDSLAIKNTIKSDSSSDNNKVEPALAQASGDEVSAGGCGEELVAIVPDGATTGSVQITVDGDTVTGPTFTVNGNNNGGGNTPTINADISPESGPIGTTVTIKGTNFAVKAGDNTVKFGSTPATVTSASTTELKVTVPNGLTIGTAYTVTEQVYGN